MKRPSRLPLLGFINPRETLPAFLVPIFGTGSDPWIQDGGRDEVVQQFSPCSVPEGKLLPAQDRQISAETDSPFIYAFQFTENHIEVGSKSTISKKLSERLQELQQFPFLIIDVLKFIGPSSALPRAIERAKRELAAYDPEIAEDWALSLQDAALFKIGGRSMAKQRVLITDGIHTQEVLAVLQKDLRLQKLSNLPLILIVDLRRNPLTDYFTD
jgi:hypothetical protein